MLVLCSFAAGTARGEAPDENAAVAALLRAYPQALAGAEGETLVWRDGTRMAAGPASDPAMPMATLLRHASILDMFRDRYPSDAPDVAPPPDSDPGRVRNAAFFAKMYGDCRAGDVTGRLVPVVWLPQGWGRTVLATTVNGVAARLERISREIDALDPETRRAAWPPGGTYNCRTIADTGAPSMHGTGAAIDLNVAISDYWLWRRGAAWRNRMPMEIVRVFERHGFIWGGRWSHYDTMHFEYRPELLDFDPNAED
jgi:hypothetical protein